MREGITQKLVLGIFLSVIVFSMSYNQAFAAQGDIAAAITDELEFDTTNAKHTDMIQWNGDIYLIAYQGESSDGYVVSVDINTDGSIDNAVIDTHEFDTSFGARPDLIKIDSDTFAIAYRTGVSTGGPITLKTFSANADGTSITTVSTKTDVITDSDPNDGPAIINVSGTIYAIVASSTGDDGFVVTRSIAADGTIGNANIDSIEYDTASGKGEADILKVSGDIFAIAYQGGDVGHGYVGTIDINTDGSIDAATGTIDKLNYVESSGVRPSMVNVSGDVYAIAYSNAGKVVTVNINTDGSIDDTVLSSFQIAGAEADEQVIINVANDVYVIAYAGSGEATEDGFITTICINSAGTIGSTAIDTFEYDTLRGNWPDILKVSGDIFAISHQGGSTDGFVSTVDIETTGTECSVVSTSSSSKSIGQSAGTALAPSFTKFLAPNEYPLTIQGTSYAHDDFGAEKTTVKVGEVVRIKVLASDDGGGSDIKRVSVYMNLHGIKRELFDSNTAVSYVNYQDPTIRNTEGIIESFTVNTIPSGLKQKITFDIIFAKEMPVSDVILQVVDEVNNSIQMRAVQAIQVIKDVPIEEKIVEPEIEIPAVDPKLKAQLQLPNWIKQTGKSWSDDVISDNGFSKSLGFMVHNDVLNSAETKKIIASSATYDDVTFMIPQYLKNNAKWLVDDRISDIEFVNAIQFLLDNGHISLQS